MTMDNPSQPDTAWHVEPALSAQGVWCLVGPSGIIAQVYFTRDQALEACRERNGEPHGDACTSH